MNKILLFFVFSLSTHASLIHEMKGPELLTDDLVKKIYPKELKPSRHLGVTTTDYNGDLNVDYKNESADCVRATLKDWKIVSTIYIRDASEPRFVKIDDFKCRSKDPDYNTYDGTYYHETQHFAARDILIKQFWNSLAKDLAKRCFKTKDDADNFIVKNITEFVTLAPNGDKEESARAKEQSWYEGEFLKKTGVVCKDDTFLKLAFSDARSVTLNDQIVRIILKDGEEINGVVKGDLTLLIAKKSKKKYYFKHRVLIKVE